jgi:recombination protein RecT
MSEAIQKSEAGAVQAAKPKDAAMTLKDLLVSNQKAITSLVPEHLTPERLMRVAVNCVAKTPGLQKCTPTSLLQCVMAAAEVGLEPGGVLGQFYLVPMGNVATPIIGYRGLLELARRSGQIASIRAVVVREKDRFRMTEGIEQTLDHEPFLDGDAGPMKYVYAVAKLRDGSVQVEVMSRAQVDGIRARSRAGSSGPWVTDYDEMAKKTVLRRLSKWLPLATERWEKALELDNGDYVDGEAVQATEATVSELVSVKERVKARRQLITDAPPVNMPPEEEQPPAPDAA